MKPAQQLQQGKGAFELIEEAFHLLRLAPLSTVASYYVGSIPFVLALLFFWSDMSRSAFAAQRLAAGAFGLTLLFFWMKTWQAVFAQNLLAALSGDPAPRWTLGRWLRVALVQAILQPSGLFLLPLALMILLPFGWIYAFYQNITALGDGEIPELRKVCARAWRQAKLWPMQNHYVLLLFKPFAFFVILNLITGVLAVPFLLTKLFGVETPFSQSLPAMLNTTFFAAILGLAYLCLDPLLKTICLLRCFYGESLTTGRDLTAELKRVQLTVGLVLLFLLVPSGFSSPRALDATPDPGGMADNSPTFQRWELDRQRGQVPKGRLKLCLGSAVPSGLIARSDGVPNVETLGYYRKSLRDKDLPAPVTHSSGSLLLAAASPEAPSAALAPPDLDRSIDQVLRQREFSWRLPRQKVEEQPTEKGALALFLDSIRDTLKGWAKTAGDWIQNMLRWVNKYLRPRQTAAGSTGTAWISGVYLVLLVVAVALVCALVFLIWRIWQGWEKPPEALAAQAIVPAPDLADENVGADELPEEGWLRLARELLEKGELRLALRAFYLAGLAHLAASNLITIAKFKSNRDYEQELQRRAHALPELLSTFAQTVSIFDRVWYGLHEVSPELIAGFASDVQRMKTSEAR